jgi:hypothetical protein
MSILSMSSIIATQFPIELFRPRGSTEGDTKVALEGTTLSEKDYSHERAGHRCGLLLTLHTITKDHWYGLQLHA